jgi:hypothetical protein
LFFFRDFFFHFFACRNNNNTHTYEECSRCLNGRRASFYGPVIFYIYTYIQRVIERERGRINYIGWVGEIDRERRIKVVKKGAKTVSDLSHGRDASRTDDWAEDCSHKSDLQYYMHGVTRPPPTLHYYEGIRICMYTYMNFIVFNTPQKTAIYNIIIPFAPMCNRQLVRGQRQTIRVRTNTKYPNGGVFFLFDLLPAVYVFLVF